MQRFWSKVERTDGCWLWTGAVDANGYGVFWIDGKTVYAHRYSWTLKHGDPGEGVIQHRCDVPRCVRDDHLLLGTHASNRADCVEKGRQNRGAKNSHAKLTENDVLAIRELSVARVPTVYLAGLFKVSRSTIKNIVRRETWAHL